MSDVGFIGVGHMGGAMAERLLDAGVALCVCDPDTDATDRLRARGAVVLAAPRAIADRCEIVFTCLPSADTCVEVAAAMAGGARLASHVECSTIGRAGIARVVAAHPGVEVVDAPISGGPKGARAGTLAAIVSGPPIAIGRVRPLLDAIAARVFVMGDRVGDAQVAKIVNNALSISALAATCEAVVLGVKAGLDAQRLVEMINASTGRNSATQDKFPKAILPRRFDYGGPLHIGSKDLALYRDEADAEGLDVRAFAAIEAVWRDAVERLGPDVDLSELIRVMEADAGVVVGADPTMERQRR